MRAQNILLTPKSKSVDDYFFGSVLNHNAQAYELVSSTKFDSALKTYVIEKLLPKYREDKLSLDKGDGLTIESIRVMRLLTTQIEDKDVGEKIVAKIKKSLKRLFKEASSQSDHIGEDFDSFFVATKNAYYSENLDLTQLNFNVLTLVNHVSKKIALDSIGLSNKQLSLYRNYFIQKAIASIDVASGCHALSALKLFSEDVVLESKHHDVFLKNGNTKLIYYLRNSFGGQAVIKSVLSATVRSNDKSKPIDVTKLATANMNEVGVDFKKILSELKPIAYTLDFKLETMAGGETFDSKTFRVYEQKER